MPKRPQHLLLMHFILFSLLAWAFAAKLTCDADPMLGIDNRNATPPAAVGAPQTAPKANPPNCPSTPVDAVPSTAEYPFWFGTATSAYQIEGASNEGGRGPSIWDTFTKAGRSYKNQTGDVAVDFYNRYQEDINMMKAMGIRNFRLSISWSRIMPTGRPPVNQAGIDFYKRVLTALRQACIMPHITLYHWDLPQPLYDEYKGWISPKIQGDYEEYARTVFAALGEYAEHWTTFNEPYTFCFVGYGVGTHAPGRCSKCAAGGDSTTEPLLCAYNVALAHARASRHFKSLIPQGKLSLNLNVDWAVPRDASSEADAAAALRQLDYMLHVYADPLYKGDIPGWIRENVPGLPRFTAEEQRMLMGSRPDYFALNHYTTNYVYHEPNYPPTYASATKTALNGTLIGTLAASEWLAVVPWGIRRVLNHVYTRYTPPYIVITESGVDVPGEGNMTVGEAVEDRFRIEYYAGYLNNVKAAAVQDGLPIRGYFAWSLVDNFEWADGYSKRFGIVFVDYTNNLTRTAKKSAGWLLEKFGVRGPAVSAFSIG